MIQILKLAAYGLWAVAGSGVLAAIYGLFIPDMAILVSAGCIFSFALLIGCIAWAVKDNLESKQRAAAGQGDGTV
ncbi:hypothetical protein [Azospirillum sp. SYSU D00513]|uniref:hypothetical protein n=1 Tax=Azospirillum sp. SYSU D00513 TaxID=2812561 RepID=UPI001A968EEA|nr:hypothetical protein [Azospirillum sp. SYSU D00513]